MQSSSTLVATWLTLHSAQKEIVKLLQILQANPQMIIVENAEEWEDDDKLPQIKDGEILKIPGSVVSLVERLDDELTRSLQHIDPHTAEYVERLVDEGSLYHSLVLALLYVERVQRGGKVDIGQDNINRVAMRRLEHVYFKVSLDAMCT